MAAQYPLHHIAFIQKLSEICPLNRISSLAKLIVNQFSSIQLNAQLKQLLQGFAFIPHLNISNINLVNAHSQTFTNSSVQSNISKKQACAGMFMSSGNGIYSICIHTKQRRVEGSGMKIKWCLTPFIHSIYSATPFIGHHLFGS